MYKFAVSQIFSKHNPQFVKSSILSSILIVSISYTSLIFIESCTRAFKVNLEEKLYSFDGDIRINAFSDKLFDASELDSHIDKILNGHNIKNNSDYRQAHAMIRSYDNQSEGVICYGFEANVDKIIDIKGYLSDIETEVSIEENEILIGYELSKKLKIGKGDSLVLFNLDKVIDEKIIYAKSMLVKDIFHTGITEYDNNITFLNFSLMSDFFGLNEKVSGHMINLKDSYSVESFDELIYNDLLGFGFTTSTWKERHASLISWLDVFNRPISLLMFFILIISIFNISISNWILISNKKRDFAILKALGCTNFHISYICICQILIVTFVSLLIGNLFSLITLLIQNKWHIIKLDSNVYFMDHLPVTIDVSSFVLLSVLVVFISLISSVVPTYKINGISIQSCMNND